METVKLLGVILVIFAGTGLGAYPVKQMVRRTRELEELYFCLLRLKSEVNHAVNHLPEALRCATSGKGKAGAYREVMRQLAVRMEEGNREYDELLSELRRDLLSKKTVTEEEAQAFCEMFLGLGGMDRNKQVQVLEYYAETIRQKIAEEKQKKKEKAYLYRCLGILGGVFLSVVLY